MHCWLYQHYSVHRVPERSILPQLNMEFPSIVCNTKVHYYIHITSQQVHILSQLKPVQTLPPYFLEVNVNPLKPSGYYMYHQA
jgi:hypothetical protein